METAPEATSKSLIIPDARVGQIAVLSGLVCWLAFGLGQIDILFRLGAACFIAIGFSFVQLGFISTTIKSNLITALSMSLLLQTPSLWVHSLCVAVALGSKRLIKGRDGVHVFNPANFGIIFGIFFLGGWITPSQWGRETLLILGIAASGWFVLNRCSRLDSALSALFGFVAVVALRDFWLGNPVNVFVHHVSSGSLYLFCFFMITDPRTTPRALKGRVIHGLLIGTTGAVIDFMFYKTGGIFYALFIYSLLTQSINRYWPGKEFRWRHATSPAN